MKKTAKKPGNIKKKMKKTAKKHQIFTPIVKGGVPSKEEFKYVAIPTSYLPKYINIQNIVVIQDKSLPKNWRSYTLGLITCHAVDQTLIRDDLNPYAIFILPRNLNFNFFDENATKIDEILNYFILFTTKRTHMCFNGYEIPSIKEELKKTTTDTSHIKFVEKIKKYLCKKTILPSDDNVFMIFKYMLNIFFMEKNQFFRFNRTDFSTKINNIILWIQLGCIVSNEEKKTNGIVVEHGGFNKYVSLIYSNSSSIDCTMQDDIRSIRTPKTFQNIHGEYRSDIIQSDTDPEYRKKIGISEDTVKNYIPYTKIETQGYIDADVNFQKEIKAEINRVKKEYMRRKFAESKRMEEEYKSNFTYTPEPSYFSRYSQQYAEPNTYIPGDAPPPQRPVINDSQLESSYKMLELDPKSEITEKIAKKAFLTLARKYHPDKPGGSTEAFQKLSQAYENVVYNII
jgi:hypothetical protein